MMILVLFFWTTAIMALVRKPGSGGAPKGPATYPFFNHQARVSVNSSPCSTTDGVFGILADGKEETNGTADPFSKSAITLSALIF
jgi:hypothetical protein